ncbi:HTH psq-type domain-containing protein [Sergentomyia squamirostris]
MPKKPAKPKPYTQEDVEKALDAFRSGKSVREASIAFQVPKSTLFNKLIGKSPVVCNIGAPTTLTPEMEKELVQWIFDCSDQWHPVTKEQVLDSVEIMCTHFKLQNKFTNGRPGNAWFRGFMKRHPELSRRTPENYSVRRANVSRAKVMNWFKNVKEYLDETNLLNLPAHRVFNCDESGFLLAPKGDKVIVRRGKKVVANVVTAEEKECVTALLTISATGNLAPPMIVHTIKRFTRDLADSNVEGWVLGKSDSGWMTSVLFYEYIANTFYNWLLEQKIEFPVILYLDGHSSHITLELSKFCKAKGIELIRLYPNATHLMQPLDTAFFGPLKKTWKKALIKWKTKNDWGKLKPKSVPKILQEAMRNMNMAEVAKNGFRGCGLLPFNPLAIKKEKFLSEFPDEDVEGNDTITLPPTEKLDLSKYANTLEVLEAHLSPTVLQEFIQCEEQGFWDGNADKNNLFKFWREVRQLHERLSSSIECSGNSDVPENLDIANLPIIFENEILSTSNDDSHPDLEDVIMDEYSKGYRVDTEHFESPPPLPLEDKFCDDCDIGDIDEDLHSLTESPTLPTGNDGNWKP